MQPENRVRVSVALEINGRAWRQVDSLERCGPHDRAFTVQIEGDQAILTFGDGKQGQRPPFRRRWIKVSYSGGEHMSVVINWGRPSGEEPDAGGFLSIYRGVVTSSQDPENAMRVKVQVPEVLGLEDAWALPCQPVGAHNIPPLGKHVWVMFEHGDPRYPVWMGVFKLEE